MKTRHGHLRPFQADVRQVFQRGRQGQYLIPYFIAAHPVRRQGYAESGSMAEAQRLPRRSGAGLPAVAYVDCYGDVSFRQGHLAQSGAQQSDIAIPKGITTRCTKVSGYHDPKNWPLLREALKEWPRRLDWKWEQHLVPALPAQDWRAGGDKQRAKSRPFATKYTSIKPKQPT